VDVLGLVLVLGLEVGLRGFLVVGVVGSVHDYVGGGGRGGRRGRGGCVVNVARWYLCWKDF
jgi:hypothetical protein